MSKTNNEGFSSDNNNLTYIIDELYEGTPQNSFTFSDFRSNKTTKKILTKSFQSLNNPKNEVKSKTLKLKSIEEISKNQNFAMMSRIAQEIFDARKEMLDTSTPLSLLFKSTVNNQKESDKRNSLSDISYFELED